MNNKTSGRNWAGSMLCVGVLMGGVTVAGAQTTDEAPRQVNASEVGHSTRAWLDLQSSNKEAAPAVPMLGAEAGLAYRRYLESFKSKIPDLYGSTLNNSGGSVGGGGSGGGSSSGGGGY